MFRKSAPIILALVFLSSMAFADSADDTYYDDDTPEYYTCENLCAVAAQCDTPCATSDCMDYCNGLSESALFCLDEGACAEFSACLCDGSHTGTNGDDDSADDDSDDNGCGCSVSKEATGAGLTAVMFLIGLAAVFIGLRAPRS